MSTLRKLILTLSFALVLLAPATALAAGAGDQQYCDPLAGCSSSGGSHSKSSGSSSHTGSSTPSSAASPASSGTGSSGTTGAVAAASTVSTTSTTGSGTSTAANGRSLPYTGIDAGLVALVGAGMLGAGYVVRRRIARERG